MSTGWTKFKNTATTRCWLSSWAINAIWRTDAKSVKKRLKHSPRGMICCSLRHQQKPHKALKSASLKPHNSFTKESTMADTTLMENLSESSLAIWMCLNSKKSHLEPHWPLLQRQKTKKMVAAERRTQGFKRYTHHFRAHKLKISLSQLNRDKLCFCKKI